MGPADGCVPTVQEHKQTGQGGIRQHIAKNRGIQETYQAKQNNPGSCKEDSEHGGDEFGRNFLLGAESVEDLRARVEEHFVRVRWWWLRGGHCEIK